MGTAWVQVTNATLNFGIICQKKGLRRKLINRCPSLLSFLGPWVSMAWSKKMGALSARPNQKDLVFMKELLEAGKVVPVIDRRYPLSEVAEALGYLGEGHARGKVVITLEHNNKT